MIKLLCIGKKHDDIYADAIAHFEKRLQMYAKFEWVLLPHSSHEGLVARTEESERILKKISSSDFVVLLDETGVPLSSPDIAKHLEKALIHSKQVVCVIGGAHGISAELKNRADVVLSFGRAVLPHQLMRVILLEQLYRSHSILAGSNYHHN